MDGNEACLGCHSSYRTDLRSHTRHAAGSTGSSCYNCHMPFTTYGLLKTIRSHQISSPSVAATSQTGRPNACNLCHLDKTLAWTADHLKEWYGLEKPRLTEDQQSIAASILWLLGGDAGQRAIVAQSMSWLPAQQISGVSWMPPYLSQLLGDPYDAVRYVASRSLRTLPGFRTFDYDPLEPRGRWLESQRKAVETWVRAGALANFRNDPQLLLDPEHTFRTAVVTRLLQERNNRHIYLRE